MPTDSLSSDDQKIQPGSDPDLCDVLVVGGGIVGAGIARDAAMRGLGKSSRLNIWQTLELLPELSTSRLTESVRQWARHLEDVMIRRTSWQYYHAHHLEIAQQVAAWMGEELGWSRNEVEEQSKRYRQLIV